MISATVPSLQYDVLVVGGGPAGVGAAVAAARMGAHTALLERGGLLGGMLTAGQVQPSWAMSPQAAFMMKSSPCWPRAMRTCR